jgi:lambda repressor-like predicted transcriptional regulator
MKPRYKLFNNGDILELTRCDALLNESGMHPEYIKAELRKNGKTQRSIACELSLSVMAVSHVIEGRGKSARVASAIADAIKSPISQIWPGKYPQLAISDAPTATKPMARPASAYAIASRKAAAAKRTKNDLLSLITELSA